MSLPILTRHLLIRSAFREKYIFTDYDYNERVFVLFHQVVIYSFLYIYIFIMSVRHIFAEFRLIFVKRSCSRRDGRKRIMFVFFILCKHNVLLILWVHTNKSRPLSVPNYVLRLPSWTKMTAYPLKKMQVIAQAPPCPAKRALASTLHTNYWIQCTFI